MSVQIVLASKSAARRAVLDGAGVAFEVAVAGVDEEAIKAGLLAESSSSAELGNIVNRDYPRWGAVIQRNNIQAE